MQSADTWIKRTLQVLIFFTALSTLVTSPVHSARNKDLKIKFDFLTGELTANGRCSPFIVRKGRNVIFRIINFNRSAFKATINGEVITDTDFAKAPAQFASTAGAGPKKDPKIPEATDARKKKTLLETLEDQIKTLDNIKKLRLILLNILYSAETYTHLEIKKNEAFIAFMNWAPTHRPPLDQEVLRECKKRVEEAGKTVQNVEESIRKHGEDGKKLLDALTELSKLKNVKEIRKKLDEIAKSEYKKALDQYAEKNGDWKKLLEAIIKLKNLLAEFKEVKYTALIKNILGNFKPENFTVSLTIPTVDGDKVKITVKIEPIDKKKNSVFHQLNSPVIVKVQGGWNIDFSTGVFFHVNAKDQDYWFEGDSQETGDQVTLRKSDDKYSITPVVSALMHIYPRQTSSVKWSGIAFGLGTGEANKLSYYLGTGVMFGSKSRFLINGGVAAVKFNSLLPEFKEKLDQPIKKPADDVAVVESKYRLRFFLSMTYNIGK